ncbi:MAG: hypothetical protein JEZ11_13030 [Desulfobacterales bacterium]|nr:hypothetical protein [Desulfobacterales bacterium]
MKAEEQTDKSASPQRSGHFSQKGKKDQRIEKMQTEIDQMVPTSMKAENADIDHVGDPCQRMPVRDIKG